jgi:ribokinase
MPRLWVVGPIAWDWTFQIDRIPASGDYLQAKSAVRRPGGTGANVAVALASTREEVRMVGYVGRDTAGRRMLAFLRKHGVDTTFVAQVEGRTSQVLLFVEPSGERTIVEVSIDLSAGVAVPVDAISAGDVVYFAVWRESFVPHMAELFAKGVLVATAPPEGDWTALPATFVIGSESHHYTVSGDIAYTFASLLAQGRLRCVVVTRGSRGAIAYCRDRTITQPAKQVTPIDMTGAGDAFTAGFLHQILLGRSVKEALRAGTEWGTAAVLVPQSTPPPWSVVAKNAEIPGHSD